MVEIVNRQRRLRIDCERWQAFTESAVKIVPAPQPESTGVTVAFVSDRAMRELNQRWRGRTGTTDVLSFPADQDEFEKSEEPTLGDVVISVDQAARQAAENKLAFDDEIAQLILHGLLHLCGFDHSTDNGEMNRLELRLRRKLEI